MNKFFSLLLIVILGWGCSAQQKVIYLQNNTINSPVETIEGGFIKFQPNDVLSIVVASSNQELADVFNMSPVTGSTYSSENIMNYTVGTDGNIDFPMIGKIKIQGLTRVEVDDLVEKKIIESGLLTDPAVEVKYINLSFSTLGEFNSPGVHSIDKDQTTIFDAISASGDLTIYGLRDKVFLTRRINNKMTTYQLDLRTTDIYNSPAFYIQQNDLIYVEPNKTKANQLSANGNTFRSVSFWMSFSSFITTFVLLFTGL